MRYSALTDINRDNVTRLKVAWQFHTGDISDGNGSSPRSGFETTPILVDDTLFLTTAFNRIIALDPAIGKQLWAYDPKIDRDWPSGDGLINRGVATWLDGERAKSSNRIGGMLPNPDSSVQMAGPISAAGIPVRQPLHLELHHHNLLFID